MQYFSYEERFANFYLTDTDVRYIEINKSICVKLILDKTFFNEKAAVLERRDCGETL